ncbi:MAG: hypothetical protein ABI743_13685 [bacterium]
MSDWKKIERFFKKNIRPLLFSVVFGSSSITKGQFFTWFAGKLTKGEGGFQDLFSNTKVDEFTTLFKTQRNEWFQAEGTQLLGELTKDLPPAVAQAVIPGLTAELRKDLPDFVTNYLHAKQELVKNLSIAEQFRTIPLDMRQALLKESELQHIGPELINSAIIDYAHEAGKTVADMKKFGTQGQEQFAKPFLTELQIEMPSRLLKLLGRKVDDGDIEQAAKELFAAIHLAPEQYLEPVGP